MTRNAELFEKIYAVLAKHAGASESMRAHFVELCTRWSERDPWQTNEFRFMGSLGMGGKFWLMPELFCVSAYSEDITPVRQQAINETNQELKKLFVPPEKQDGKDRTEV